MFLSAAAGRKARQDSEPSLPILSVIGFFTLTVRNPLTQLWPDGFQSKNYHVVYYNDPKRIIEYFCTDRAAKQIQLYTHISKHKT